MLSHTGLLPSVARRSSRVLLAPDLVTPRRLRRAVRWVPLPRHGNAVGLSTMPVWADPVSLATTQGLTVVFSSSG